jgi:uncharacterized protein YndB with AHSA1/START domain
MTRDPDVPLRLELAVELPGTPELVWDAIATANGISSWFVPTDVDEREGGAVCFHMGEQDSPGTVTGWDPPRRFAYVEPDWATFSGRDPSSVSPLATEFLVEAQSGGTCVVRVVTSAFGTGADWEREFFDEMEQGWRPFFENLRLYLTHFPGQRVTSLSVAADVPGRADAVWSAGRQALGAEELGQRVDALGVHGRVERLGKEELLLRLTDPVPGFLAFYAFDKGEQVDQGDQGEKGEKGDKGGDQVSATVQGYLFSDGAPAFVEREQPAWQAWLEGLAVPAGGR